ncbi:MAG: RNA polymerase sigma-70 factor [Bacteroidetes bacterium]|nr:MAG: RNA polymerase sigma-70 factor [Bacteroidota bacterium]
MNQYNDNESLIAGLKEGDKNAYEFLFRKYYAALCHYAERYIKDSVVAEDLVAQVFCNLFIKRNELSILSLQPYLFFSVKNSALNHIRSQKNFIDIDGESYAGLSFESNAAQINHDFSNPILHKEADKLLESAINSLPPQCREIFMLSRHQRLSYKEIAVKLGISVNTVETQMSRAIKKLSKLLGGYIKLFGLLISLF